MTLFKKTVLCLIAFVIIILPPVYAKEKFLFLKLAVPPSVIDSGVLNTLLPKFEKKNNLRVEVVGAETAKALKLAENGEVDAVMTNDPDLEFPFMEKRLGSDRKVFMHSNLVIVGPPSDPARIKGEGAKYAFYNIAETKAPFISRGDGSDIHQREKWLWASVNVKEKGKWYMETGKDMAGTLIVASEKKGYTLSDLQSYAVTKEMLELEVLIDGDPTYLKTVYSIIAVSPKRFPFVKYGTAMMLIEYLTSREAQYRIAGYVVNGERPFCAGE